MSIYAAIYSLDPLLGARHCAALQGGKGAGRNKTRRFHR